MSMHVMNDQTDIKNQTDHMVVAMSGIMRQIYEFVIVITLHRVEQNSCDGSQHTAEKESG